MSKFSRFSILTIAFVGVLSMTTFAGQWKQDSTGYWWENDDGSYPTNTWVWLDGNKDGTAECYYFNDNGYMLANTITPDCYTVGEDGSWYVGDLVQTRKTETSGTQASEDLSKYVGTYHFDHAKSWDGNVGEPNLNEKYIISYDGQNLIMTVHVGDDRGTYTLIDDGYDEYHPTHHMFHYVNGDMTCWFDFEDNYLVAWIDYGSYNGYDCYIKE